MSKPWRITRGDQQFTVADVAELKLKAAGGKIEASDLIQRPDGTEWLYASEVSELTGLLKSKPVDDDDDLDFGRKRGASPAVHKIARLLTVAADGSISLTDVASCECSQLLPGLSNLSGDSGAGGDPVVAAAVCEPAVGLLGVWSRNMQCLPCEGRRAGQYCGHETDVVESRRSAM